MTGPGELSTRKFSNLNFPAVACPAEIIASWYYRRRLCSCDSQVETHSFSFKTSQNFVFCLLSFSSYSRFSLSSLPFLFFSFIYFADLFNSRATSFRKIPSFYVLVSPLLFSKTISIYFFHRSRIYFDEPVCFVHQIRRNKTLQKYTDATVWWKDRR